MARIRTIKPEFFTSLTIADLTPEQRLTFIGLWTHADDMGRCVDDPRLIKAAIWPLDDRTAADIEIDLKALTASSLIVRYSLTRKRYLAISGWSEHQRINRPTDSKIPPPEDGEIDPPEPPTSSDEDSRSAHGEHSETSRQERKGKEGNREQGTGNFAGASSELETLPPPAGAEAPTTAQSLVAEWLDHIPKRPPGAVIGQTSKILKQLLDEDIDPRDIRAGLVSWARKGLHPSTLPSEVNAAMNTSNVIQLPTGQTITATGTDATVAGWAAVSQQLAIQDGR